MHQSILHRLRLDPGALGAHRLRFIRSSSAALPGTVMAQLEAAFGVPVIEAYGMTEASHQMASNPLPPGERKSGSVGLPAGAEIAVLDPAGRRLGAGAEGEVVVRGAAVTTGYLGDPEANRAAFVDVEAGPAWFRTGDLGRFDADGYLFLAGRIKELINRGGEKISPLEVEEVLVRHPAVARVAVFAAPDPRLGEDVCAAVVPAGGLPVDEAELRRFAAERLAAHKVPRRVLLLGELPTSGTGKIQRSALARTLGVELGGGADDGAAVVPCPPRNPVEELLARLWAETLAVEVVSVHQPFLALGGDSMIATRLLARLERETGVTLAPLEFFDAPSIAEQASLLISILADETRVS
jgi:acyl-CoA synthetase (AMP-forming)/AMP-acid ligase II